MNVFFFGFATSSGFATFSGFATLSGFATITVSGFATVITNVFGPSINVFGDAHADAYLKLPRTCSNLASKQDQLIKVNSTQHRFHVITSLIGIVGAASLGVHELSASEKLLDHTGCKLWRFLAQLCCEAVPNRLVLAASLLLVLGHPCAMAMVAPPSRWRTIIGLQNLRRYSTTPHVRNLILREYLRRTSQTVGQHFFHLRCATQRGGVPATHTEDGMTQEHVNTAKHGNAFQPLM